MSRLLVLRKPMPPDSPRIRSHTAILLLDATSSACASSEYLASQVGTIQRVTGRPRILMPQS